MPNNIFDVDISVNFTIGPDSKSGDNFLVRIVTPNNLHVKNGAKHAIVLNDYSWSNVLLGMESILEKCQGYDWLDISENYHNLCIGNFRIIDPDIKKTYRF